jgi:hypothetical protein
MDQYKIIGLLVLDWCCINVLQFPCVRCCTKVLERISSFLIKLVLDFFSPSINSYLQKMWEKVIMAFLKVMVKKSKKIMLSLCK